MEIFIHENNKSKDYIKCDCGHKFAFNLDDMKKDKIICPKCKQNLKGYLESWMAIFNPTPPKSFVLSNKEFKEKYSNRFYHYSCGDNKVFVLIEDDIFKKVLLKYIQKEGYCFRKDDKAFLDEKLYNKNEPVDLNAINNIITHFDRRNRLFNKKNDSYSSGLEEFWSDSRWEGDVCEPYFVEIRSYSLDDIICEFIDAGQNIYPPLQWEKIILDDDNTHQNNSSYPRIIWGNEVSVISRK